MPTMNPAAYGKAIDLSTGINIIPNQWGVIGQLNIFKHKHNTQKQVMIPRKTEQQHILEDRNWDERNP